MSDHSSSGVHNIVVEKDESSLRIIIDRPSDGNILSLDMIDALSSAIRSASGCKTIVLQTAGSDFCLGRDHKGPAIGPSAVEIRDALTRPIMGLYESIASAPVPIICAVQGRARGLGCALAASCDITIAADDALFGMPELKGDLPPTLAMSTMMTRISRKTLGWMVYGMRDISAADAKMFGLVSEVVPAAALSSTITELTVSLSARSREALSAVKEYLRSAPAMSAQGAADYATSLLASVMSSKMK